MENLSDKEIGAQYNVIKDYHEKFLKRYGVQMPKLKSKKGYVKDALILIYLSIGYPKTKKVSKTELTQFIRKFYPDTNDVQQARHLGAQKGWYIAAGGRDNVVVHLKRGEYQLYTLEQPYSGFHGHRVSDDGNWNSLKKQYGYRCATCGSVESKPNIHWQNTATKLQKSHKDPTKPLVKGNIIPQCQKCNRADRNNWVYDERGRVIKLANPSVINRSSQDVQLRVYEILYRKFKGINPYEKRRKRSK